MPAEHGPRSFGFDHHPDRRPVRDDHGSAGATLSLITYAKKN